MNKTGCSWREKKINQNLKQETKQKKQTDKAVQKKQMEKQTGRRQEPTTGNGKNDPTKTKGDILSSGFTSSPVNTSQG